MRPIPMRRIAAFALSTMFALTACGASDASIDSVLDETPSTDAPVVTEVPDATAATPDDPLDVEFSSEPIEAGPLFGGSNASVADAASEDSASCSSEDDEACADVIDDEPPRFEPAAIDRPFCSLLDDLNGRPFPSDEAEAAMVIRVWIGELRNVAVESVSNDLDLLIDVLDDAIASEGNLAELGSTPELDAASVRLDSYVESACNGIDVTESDDRPTATLEDPPLPDGIVIPVIEFAEDSETGRPVFGEKDASKIDASFVPSETDRGFCTALDIVNSRPQPTEDFDEVRFVDGYLRAIEPLAPVEIRADFEVILDWTGRIIEAGGFTDVAEDEAAGFVGDAVESIDDFVDARCHGL